MARKRNSAELIFGLHLETDVELAKGPEFTAKPVRSWLCKVDVTTLFTEPGSPWENG